jgi:carbon storage regulator
MLVLSRKKDESIVINNDITIVVVEIRGDKVRLGVEAPKDVPVHRREVFEAIARGEPVDLPAVSNTTDEPAAPADPAR